MSFDTLTVARDIRHPARKWLLNLTRVAVAVVGIWILVADLNAELSDSCTDSAVSCPETADTVEIATGLFCTDCTDLYIVAHQDDDLLFMAPDIDRSIQAGNAVSTVYVTAGDADKSAEYWLGREAGIRAAHAQMADVPNEWVVTSLSLEGNDIQKEILAAAPGVSVVFMRLPNSYDKLLEKLWDRKISWLRDVEGRNKYGRSELIDVLVALMEVTAPNRIAILDPTEMAHGEDHSDHIHTARFAFEAHQRYFSRHSLTSYRTYNIKHEIVNLSESEQARKRSIFDAYAVHDTKVSGDDYDAYKLRQYATSGMKDIVGRVVGLAAKCLQVAGVAENTPVQISACDGGLHQIWYAHPDGTFRVYGARGSSMCLTAPEPVNGANLVLQTCNRTAAQRFLLTSEGRILGPEARCVDIEGAGTADGTPVQLWECADVDQQRWTMEMGPAGAWSFGADFSDDDLDGGDVTKALSFGLPDLDGDGKADACARLSDGVWCALNDGGSFGPYTRWTTEFSDRLGWGIDEHGTTLRYADLDDDGLDDVCGRGYWGMICAHSTGSAFASSSLRTTGTDFSNPVGFTDPARYRSIDLGDVNGDGAADVCGRSADGVLCAINTGFGDFAPATNWLPDEFTDALGWGDAKYGATVTLGDIDGDGMADICGRGSKGIHCARSAETRFEHPSYWSADYDFGDSKGWGAHVAYWGSIRLADINGDGAADACGRGVAGIWCSVSEGGTGFDVAGLVMPRDFTDAKGWLEERYGATIRFADLNNDGHADVCGRGASELLCAIGL